MKEFRLEIKNENSEQNNPGNTPIGARIPIEVRHTMCTMREKTSKLCLHCLIIYKEVTLNVLVGVLLPHVHLLRFNEKLLEVGGNVYLVTWEELGFSQF